MRFTAAKTLSRPAFGDLNPGLTYDVPLNANVRPQPPGGNPDLKPQKSNAYDATVEYYFATSSYLAAAVYYRELKDRTVVEVEPEVIDGIEYNISRPRNAAEATLQGVELSAQFFVDSFMQDAGFWGGFGAMANFTLADSEIKTQVIPSRAGRYRGYLRQKDPLGPAVRGVRRDQPSGLHTSFRLQRDPARRRTRAGRNGPEFNGVRDNGRLDLSLGYDLTRM